VHDILDLTRLESGHYSLSKALCDLSEMVGWCVDMMGPRVTERNLRLAACCDPEVTAWGEERGIRQILINLLEYATQSGREQHTITLGARFGEPGEAIITLRDDGEGLLPSIEDALANPLESSANPAEPGGSSSWFGLTLVKSFLDLHNGVLRSKRQEDGCMLIEVVLPR
jgi:signal transduction histidine kinase